MENRITLLRNKLKEIGCSAMIIPSNDPHFGEYTQSYYKTRVWLSGFTGSAATLVVTLEDAALWTDSRYFVQAEKELHGTGIRLMKLKMPQTPSLQEWIRSLYPQGGKVAVDQTLFSHADYLSLQKTLAPCSVVCVEDFISQIWTERPALQFNTIEYLPVSYTGEETASKLNRVVNGLRMEGARFAYLVTACDEVAWLCNIRGTDIRYNPLPQSYAVIMPEEIHLFVEPAALSAETVRAFADQPIHVHPYAALELFLKGIPTDYIRVCSSSKITVRDYQAIAAPGALFVEDPVPGGIISHLKSVKNRVELDGFRKAFEEDGVAWCKVLAYIYDALDRGMPLDEYSIGEKLIEFRKESPLYRGESFEPIVAFGPAAALPHYNATREHSGKVGTDNFLLMDTGGQYLCGTTDTTRTLPLGTLTEEQKRHYTLVLKGMINLSEAKFPKGTRGSQLDVLARGPLFNDGLMYFHGTCHGIGHYLCVHEGPQSVRMEENPVTLQGGMVISNEPAIYFEGKYGIRTENVMAVEPWKTTEFNDFYRFNTFTRVPILLHCVQKELLTQQEIDWVNQYNAQVYAVLHSRLNASEVAWLKKICQPF